MSAQRPGNDRKGNRMDLANYFTKATGTGVLATADAAGRTNTAIYARPRVLDDGQLAMLMRERRTYRNLTENPYAAYLFMEDGSPLRGIRLYLEKTGEGQDAELIAQMTRRSLTPAEDRAKGPKHLVYFRVTDILNLVGPERPE